MASIVRRFWSDELVWSLAVSSDGALIAAGCGTKLLVWDMQTGSIVLGPLEVHTRRIWSVAFSRDVRMIASASSDNTICIWDVKGGTQVMDPLRGHTEFVYCVTFSHDGRLVSSSGDGTIRLWDTNTGQPDEPSISTRNMTWSVAISPDSTKIAGACQDGDVRVYNAITREELFHCAGHTNSTHSVVFSPDSRLIASASYDCTVRLWDGTTGDAISNPLEGHSNLVTQVAFSPDGRLLASGSDDQTVRIWDLETGNLCDELSEHTNQISGVVFVPHSNKFISAAVDRTVVLWDLHTLVSSTNAVAASESIFLESQTFQAKISSIMSPAEIVQRLNLHGCADLTNQLDLNACGDFPISSGGLGDIYRCKLITGPEVAIKTIRFNIDSSDQNRKHFKQAARELYAWSRCRHPNVQRLLGLAMFRNRLAMITPWEVNGDLPQHLARNPTTDRCIVSAQVADGLSYMHECGVIHGDLKGANILVSRRGVPQLTDFGNAMLLDSTLQFTATSAELAISLRWAAPELFTGGQWSIPADIYALGMTILEIITGEVPWPGKLDHAVMFAVTLEKAHPQRPLKYIPEDSEHGNTLWSLLRRCWEFEPEKRPIAEEVKLTMKSITQDGLISR